MGRYHIRVATGDWIFSGSYNRVQLWLVGALGEAELELQLRPARGEVSGLPRGPRAGLGWAGGGPAAARGRIDRRRFPGRCDSGKKVGGMGRVESSEPRLRLTAPHFHSRSWQHLYILLQTTDRGSH